MMATLSTSLADYIKSKIDSKEWTEGAMLPTEAQLCGQFNVSRTTVRNAMAKLVNEGKLKRIRGKGTFVAKPKKLERSTIFIESFAEATHNSTVESSVLEFRVCPIDQEISEKMGGAKEAIKLVRVRHIHNRPDDGPLVLSITYFPTDLSFLLKHDFEKEYVHQVLRRKGHGYALHQKELIPCMLPVKVCRQLSIETPSLGMLIQSSAFDESNHLVAFTQSYYPKERNKFELIFSV